MKSKGAMWETIKVQIKGQERDVYKNLPASVRDLFVAVSTNFPKRDYIVYQNERYTYEQTAERVATIAELFRQRGVVKGDRGKLSRANGTIGRPEADPLAVKVGILMRNVPEWILSFMAITSMGGIAVAINAWSPLEALVHCFNNSGCKVAVVDPERAAVLVPALSAIREGGCASIFVARTASAPAGFECFEAALEGCGGVPLPKVDIAADDHVTIFFTSGTTSLPKGVLSTQRQFLSNLPNSAASAARAALRRGDPLPTPDPTAAQRAILLSVPLFHVTGCQSLLFLATAAGGKIVLMHKWDVNEAVKAIKAERITTAGGVPHMVMELIDSLDGHDDHILEGLSFGGAPSSDRLPSALRKSVPKASASNAYGLTEVNAVATSHSAEDYLNRPKSCGIATPVTEVKIMCTTSKAQLPPNQTGEIYIRGPNVAEGYWRSEKATSEAFLPGGWFASGDVGHLDEEGWLYISDRAKEIIIRGGENISTVAVENALYRDERIKDCAVVPVPDPKLGELVAAVIVPKPQYSGGQITSAQLATLVAKHLPKHCVPVLIVIRDQEMPRNATGKIVKKDLKAELGKIWEERTKGDAGRAKL
ncbi:hypothetical protein P7C70_g424, partial [Phenoliferia sp. Uapishka_3]